MGLSADNRLGSNAGHRPADSAFFTAKSGTGRAGSMALRTVGRVPGKPWGWDALQSSWRAQEPEIAAEPRRQGSLEAHPQ